MSRPRFEDALDACVEELAGGRATVDECLDRWPQFRADLQPLLEAAAAMQRFPRIAERPPEPARRAQLMAAIRTTPQHSRHRAPARILRSIPSILTAPATAFSGLGRGGLVAAPAAIAAAAVLAVVLVLSQGASTAYAATLTVFTGSVERQVDGAWQPLADGAGVDEATRLRTGPEGRALLTFLDGSTVGIEPQTELVIELARVNGSRQIRLQQLSGRLWNSVVEDERPGALYVVRTPDAIVSARGTLFETAVHDGETEVTTSTGLVEVQAGDQRVFVTPGETTSARAHSAVEPARRHAPAEQASLALTVNAPFAASVVAPDGRATGVRPDGVAFHQITGAVTSNPGEGAQRIELPGLTPGRYLLLLRRVGAGDGEVVLTLGPDELRFPVESAGEAVRVEITITVEDGRLTVRPVNVRAVAAAAIEHDEQVRVPELAKQRAVSVAAQLARAALPSAAGRGSDDEKRDDSSGQGSRPPDAATDGASKPSASGSQGRDDEKKPPRTLEDEARERLRERLAGESPDSLTAQLDEDTRNALRERLAVNAAEAARGCRDVAAIAPEAAASCRKVVEAAQQGCTTAAGAAGLPACGDAMLKAAHACGELPAIARLACQRDLEALRAAVEEKAGETADALRPVATEAAGCAALASPGSEATTECARVLAAPRSACEDASVDADRKACREALEKAAKACEKLTPDTRSACKEAIEALLGELDAEHGSDDSDDSDSEGGVDGSGDNHDDADGETLDAPATTTGGDALSAVDATADATVEPQPSTNLSATTR